MINPSELVRRPVRERDLLPIATDLQVIERFQERIEDIRREVKSPIRAPHFRHSRLLLHMSSEEQYSLIGGGFNSWSGKSFPRQRVKIERAQELLFKTMSAYGFDEEISRPLFRYNYEHKRWEKDITERPDGTTREALIYPSQTTKGLVFERVRDFVTQTKETTDAWWNVVDEGPLMNIKNIFRRNPKPQISP